MKNENVIELAMLKDDLSELKEELGELIELNCMKKGLIELKRKLIELKIEWIERGGEHEIERRPDLWIEFKGMQESTLDQLSDRIARTANMIDQLNEGEAS